MKQSLSRFLVIAATGAVLLFAHSAAAASVPQDPFEGHVDQHDLANLVAGGMTAEAFIAAFDGGDGVFFFPFTRVDGVGANVGNGELFTRVPRADLDGPGQWGQHFPARPTGPNEQSCGACHAIPFGDGAGGIAHNVHRDPLHAGSPAQFIQRQTPHLFGSGGVQRLAEEMTEELHAIRDAAAQQACATGQPAARTLVSKGVNFGAIRAVPQGSNPCTVVFQTHDVVGVASDLVVRPFGWKGDTASLREFQRDAAHRELGMQPVELVGYGADGDYDGTVDELTVGDLTALAIYVSAQPRPTSLLELQRRGLLDEPLDSSAISAIGRGRVAFDAIGCAACHIPSLALDAPFFSEPSQNASYRDNIFPGGQDPISEGLSPAQAVTYDLTRDQPDNVVIGPGGQEIHMGSFKLNAQGGAQVELFGDLKRHNMGPGLAEAIDEIGTGVSVFTTENLWGVGSTPPYLHDGRATTLAEAVLAHGGEAVSARNVFASLPSSARDDIVAFLQNLVLLVIEGEE